MKTNGALSRIQQKKKLEFVLGINKQTKEDNHHSGLLNVGFGVLTQVRKHALNSSNKLYDFIQNKEGPFFEILINLTNIC